MTRRTSSQRLRDLAKLIDLALLDLRAADRGECDDLVAIADEQAAGLAVAEARQLDLLHDVHALHACAQALALLLVLARSSPPRSPRGAHPGRPSGRHRDRRSSAIAASGPASSGLGRLGHVLGSVGPRSPSSGRSMPRNSSTRSIVDWLVSRVLGQGLDELRGSACSRVWLCATISTMRRGTAEARPGGTVGLVRGRRIERDALELLAASSPKRSAQKPTGAGWHGSRRWRRSSTPSGRASRLRVARLDSDIVVAIEAETEEHSAI